MPADPLESVTLVAFCRRPAPGVGKRRLAAVIGDTAAFQISALLLAATLEDLRAWPGPVVVAPAGAADEAWGHELPLPAHEVLVQPEGNLGVRLAGVDRALRDRGHRRIIYIGSDAPVLADADYRCARDALLTHDVVLGPALDGGVTCMGSGVPWPELADLPWSSAELHAGLLTRCLRAGLTVQNLPPRYDVDVPADLRRLGADLAGDRRPARRALYHALAGLGYCGP